MKKWYWHTFLALMAIAVTPIVAQTTCPPKILLSFGRSASACFNMVRGEACYGNGTVSVEQLDASTQRFEKAGDKLDLLDVKSIDTISVTDELSVATLYTQANQPDTEEINTVFLLFGDVHLENLVPYTPSAVVKAIGTATVRQSPQENADILLQIAVNDTLIANGQSEDSQWLRVQIPNTTAFGWVSKNVITSSDNLAILNNQAETEPFEQPFSRVQFTAGTIAVCPDAVPSGLFIQATSVKKRTEITLNGLKLSVQGTLFLTMNNEQLVIYTISGEVDVTTATATHFIPAGAKGTVADNTIDITAYVSKDVNALPITILPYRTTLANPISSEEIALLTAQHLVTPVPTAIPQIATPDPAICRYSIKRDATLFQGPAEYYEARGDIRAEEVVTPFVQATDPDGNIWWQLSDSSWIQANNVSVTGICADIPVTTNIPAPYYNTFVMETCQTRNGPLREGQYVSIEFTPPAFDSYDAAIASPRIDPGRINVDSQKLSVDFSSPIVFGTSIGNKYAIRFNATWEATAGTHRIAIDRLSYELTCQITVPVG